MSLASVHSAGRVLPSGAGGIDASATGDASRGGVAASRTGVGGSEGRLAALASAGGTGVSASASGRATFGPEEGGAIGSLEAASPLSNFVVFCGVASERTGSSTPTKLPHDAERVALATAKLHRPSKLIGVILIRAVLMPYGRVRACSCARNRRTPPLFLSKPLAPFCRLSVLEAQDDPRGR